MRTAIHSDSFTVWLSAQDTYDWAGKPMASWPCSTLANKRLVASFDTNGLYDLSVNGRDTSEDTDGNELSAMVSDFMANKLPKDHPCYFVAVGQFQA